MSLIPAASHTARTAAPAITPVPGRAGINFTEEEPKEYCKCAYCGDAIYYGDYYYEIGYDCVCEDCISEMKREAM